jgi:hypothetical protein
VLFSKKKLILFRRRLWIKKTKLIAIFISWKKSNFFTLTTKSFVRASDNKLLSPFNFRPQTQKNLNKMNTDKQKFSAYNLEVEWDNFILASEGLVEKLIEKFSPIDQVNIFAIWKRSQNSQKKFTFLLINFKNLLNFK